MRERRARGCVRTKVRKLQVGASTHTLTGKLLRRAGLLLADPDVAVILEWHVNRRDQRQDDKTCAYQDQRCDKNAAPVYGVGRRSTARRHSPLDEHWTILPQ